MELNTALLCKAKANPRKKVAIVLTICIPEILDFVYLPLSGYCVVVRP